ncbi:hypothetical protein HNR27_002816 [Ornithinibacillus bavariensis]
MRKKQRSIILLITIIFLQMWNLPLSAHAASPLNTEEY